MIISCLSISCSPPPHHPGIDPSPAVFGVVRRTSESDIDAHSNQQVLILVHSWNTGGEPELISVLHTTGNTVVYNVNSSAQLSSMQSA